MRIIGGTRKGRIIHPPKRFSARPTTDLAKESLFNILDHKIDISECRILDLFAGSGSISFEFASRDAIEVTSVELDFNSVDFIRKTARELELNQIITIRSEVFRYLKSSKRKWDIIFADPPFSITNFAEIPELVFKHQLMQTNGLLIIEHPPEVSFNHLSGFKELRSYGRVNFSFFS